jgi:lysophospholipase L1-like esterase
MNLRFHISLLTTLTALLPLSFSKAQSPPIRIMPLGDSITGGSSFDNPDGSGGYRGALYELLGSAGYNVDSIGSLTINSGLLSEKEHEGHSGWRIDQLDSNLAGWLESYADPDVVLIHIGTNDFGQNVDTANAIDRLDGLILKTATLRPYAHIIVTNLMVRNEPQNTSIQRQFNPFVEDIVADHAAAGRRVTFLDMRAVVPLSDMPDQLHPGQVGYNKMANAWLGAIQAVIGPDGDDAPPELVSAIGSDNQTQVTLKFSKPVADDSIDPAKYSIDNGLTVSAASLDDSKRLLTLTTDPQAEDITYTIAVNDVTDRIAPTPNTIAADATATFERAIPRGYSSHVPEAEDYTLVQSVDLPTIGEFRFNGVPYDVDQRSAIGPFDRVAYYLELQKPNGSLQYLWASMDAFTEDANKLAVPTRGTGAIFQESVSNLKIVSNATGVTTGDGQIGNLEFWATNYTEPNDAEVPGADDATFDSGDTRSQDGDYGSMQIHNSTTGETLFAFNHWGAEFNDTAIDLGLGDSSGENPDWTFANNGGSYRVKILQILVRTTNDTTAPSAVAAAAHFSRSKVTLTFSEPIAPASVDAANFSLDQDVEILAASLSDNQRDLVLTTSAQPDGVTLTLTFDGIRDTSANGNVIAAGTTIAVTGPALPGEIIMSVGAAAADYELVSRIELPGNGTFNESNAAYRLDDRDATGPFKRVAYYLELQKPGDPPQFIWTAMDAFTADRRKLGPPTAASGTYFQTDISNLDVISNVAGVTTGNGLAGGNIEFWPSNYNRGNASNIPGADGGTFDFGDGGSNSLPGYGSMQIHNHDAGETLIAINRFGTDDRTLDLGIGNQAAGDPDWTFANNAGDYAIKNLSIFVRPTAQTATEPFLLWLAENEITHANNDDDRDQISALLEWFLNGDPTVADPSILPTGSVGDGNFAYSFQRPTDIGTADWLVQSSDNLVDWQAVVDGTSGVTISEEASTGGYLPVTITFAESSSPLFVRLMVTGP